MTITAKIDQLFKRLHDRPQYPTQGAVLFVDLEARQCRRGYLPLEVVKTFLTAPADRVVAAR